MLSPRDRIVEAVNHRQPDTLPIDFGATSVTGIHVSSVYRLRQLLKLDPPGKPVKVTEPYQMLGEIEDDLLDALGADCVPLVSRMTFYGFPNENWKPWTTFDGTPVLVPEGFNTEPDENGDILLYPEGDGSARPSARMPQGGWYFDTIVRQEEIDENTLSLDDNLEEFVHVTDQEVAWFAAEAERLRRGSDRAIVAYFGGTDFGNISFVPVPWIKNPKGIRGIEEWYIWNLRRPDHIHAIFERQCEVAIHNLGRFWDAVGDRVTVAFIVGNDFGAQTRPFISPRMYRSLYKPYHKRLNDWIHANTTWKTFQHTDGSIKVLMEDFIEAGFDILNPLQWSAADMDPVEFKERFGSRVTFWGAGIDTQQTLPRGSPGDVRAEIMDRSALLGVGGGFVFSTIHNLQPMIPDENLLALVEAIRELKGA